LVIGSNPIGCTIFVYGVAVRKAIYAGSFDPFTFGHLSVAVNAARVFDEVIILVAVNESKKHMFSVEERVALIEKVVKSFGRISVDYTDGYVVGYAEHNDCNFMVRGIRNKTDAMSEMFKLFSFPQTQHYPA
jgi:pantetheine-phosphate adenylyltransferase